MMMQELALNNVLHSILTIQLLVLIHVPMARALFHILVKYGAVLNVLVCHKKVFVLIHAQMDVDI